MSKPRSASDADILAAIATATKATYTGPTAMELADNLGLSPSVIYERVSELRARGLVNEPKGRHGITLTPAGLVGALPQPVPKGDPDGD